MNTLLIVAHYARHAAGVVERALAATPVVVITGPRQSGKSTLAAEIADARGAPSVTLDDPGRQALAEDDPTGLAEMSDGLLLIVEFQKAPALMGAIKSRVDRIRRSDAGASGVFLLTGSANIWATLRVSESLVGRATRVHLWPLSQGEFAGRRETFLEGLIAGEIPTLSDRPARRSVVSHRVTQGGFPLVAAMEDGETRSRWLHDYLEMSMERDARDVIPRARQLDELPSLFRLVSGRPCSLVEPTTMAKEIGMKKDSVRRYLKLLESLYLIKRVPSWSADVGRQVIKSPKLWITDTGLACQAAGLSAERFEADTGALAGGMFESFVAMELVKQASFTFEEVRFFHFRAAGEREVDIVIERPDGTVAGIEVKLTATPSPADFKGLKFLREKLGDRFIAGALVHVGPDTVPYGDRLWAVPVEALWS